MTPPHHFDTLVNKSKKFHTHPHVLSSPLYENSSSKNPECIASIWRGLNPHAWAVKWFPLQQYDHKGKVAHYISIVRGLGIVRGPSIVQGPDMAQGPSMMRGPDIVQGPGKVRGANMVRDHWFSASSPYSAGS